MSDRQASVFIVVVNDDLRLTITEYLRRHELEVRETGSLSAALQYLVAHRPDVIVLDLLGQYGDHSLEWLVTKRYEIDLARTPVAILRSEPPKPGEKRTARDLGFVFFAPRPSSRREDLEALARTVLRAVEAGQTQDRGNLRASSHETTTTSKDLWSMRESSHETTASPQSRRAQRESVRKEASEDQTALRESSREERATTRARRAREFRSSRESFREERASDKDRQDRDRRALREAFRAEKPSSERTSSPQPRSQWGENGWQDYGPKSPVARPAKAPPPNVTPGDPRGATRRAHEPRGEDAARGKGSRIQGDLENLSVPEILSKIYAKTHSGKLILSQGSVKKKIYFMGGFPIFVTSNLTSETLGEQLRRQGRLRSQDQRLALEHMQKTGRRFSQVIVDLDLIKQTELDRALRETIRETILGTFASRRGSYRFDKGTGFGEHEFSFSLSPPRLIIDGLRRHGDDALIRRYLPSSPKDRPHLLASPIWESGDLTLTEQEVQIAMRLEAGLRIEQIARETGIEPTHLERFVVALSVLGLVEFRSVRGSDIAPPKAGQERVSVVTGPDTGSPIPRELKDELERVAAADFFAILGVGHDVSSEQVHAAFRELVRPFHADAIAALAPDQQELAKGIQRRLVEAYLVLSDNAQREKYLRDLGELALTPEEAAQRAAGRRKKSTTSIPPPLGPAPGAADISTSPADEPSGFWRGLGPTPTSGKSSQELLLEAKAALKAKRAQEAALHMREALKVDPGRPHLLAWAGWTLFWANPSTSARNALSLLEEAINADSSHPDAYLFMARIHEFQGKYDEALGYYNAALKKSNIPPAVVKEASAFQERLQESRVQARSAGLRLIDVMEEDERTLFRRWVLDD